MKKVFAILLAMMLVLSMGTAAMAEDETTTPTNEATLAKVVTITNEGTGASIPANTEFSFTVTKKDVTDAAGDVTVDTMPQVTINNVKYEAGKEMPLVINLPSYSSVGVYTYTIKENAGSVGGMIYDTAERVLKVTVVNGDTDGTYKIAGTSLVGTTNKKSDTFMNVYNAGELKVSKTVTGNLGDKSKYFEFKVTLTGETGKTYTDSYVVTGGSNSSNPNIMLGQETTFLLKHGDTISIANLPYGVTYKVEETDAAAGAKGEGKEYEVEYDTNASGTISAAETSTTVTNTKSADIDTGITTDSLPYILLMAFVVLSGAVLLLKRRNAYND